MKNSWRDLRPREGHDAPYPASAPLAWPDTGGKIALSCILASVVAVILLFAFPHKINAAPPAEAKLQHHTWFESLEQPGERHLLCCSISDCHLTASRVSQDGYEVAIEDAWMVVPADRVLQNVANPTGRAVVCYRRILDPELERWELRIFCFVRPPEV